MDGTGRAVLSTFPVGVNGIFSSSTIMEGTMCRGTRCRRKDLSWVRFTGVADADLTYEATTTSPEDAFAGTVTAN